MRIKKTLFLWFVFLFLLEICLRLSGAIYYIIHTAKHNKGERNKIRILCVGESTTFGIGTRGSDDYPTQLNNLLDKKYPDKFLVYNRGVPGITSSLILLNLKRFMKTTNPQLVILLCASNELSCRLNVTNSLLILGNNNLITYPVFKISRFLWNLRIYRLIMLTRDYLRYKFVEYCGAFINLGADFGANEQYKGEALKLRREQYRFNIKKITQYIRGNHAEIIYTTYLHPTELNSIEEVAGENNVILCNQVRMLKEKNIPVDHLLAEDGFHANAQGYRVMAMFLLETLEKNNIIGKLIKNCN